VNVSPVFLQASSVVTVHDLAFMIHPNVFPAAKRSYLRALVGRSVASANHIITPSVTTAEDLIERFGVSHQRISVIPEGVDERFRVDRELPRPLADPYILYVGTIEPRKNLPMLIRAFARLRAEGYRHRLALVGGNGWMYEEVYELITELGLSQTVVTTGFVEDLVPWYNHADLFVYPSMFEGFGLPPLEALACGTPVVASSARSLKEVVGEAAVYFALDDEDDIVTALRRVIDDRSLAEGLRIAGPARASLFSWDETARRTVGVYEQAADQPVGRA
jgi:glycosyltransferase involved in cell wall biosynthesis